MGSKLGGTNMYDTVTANMEYGVLPLSTSSSSNMLRHEVIIPGFYQPAICDRNLPVKSVIESGLNSMLGAARKRARDSVDYTCGDTLMMPRKTRVLSVEPDTALDIHWQRSELDQLIAQHTKRMRLEIEERVRQQTKELLAVIQHGIVWKLMEKGEEIQRVGKLNLVLQERIKALSVENQLLRGIVQTSEAAANSLRNNLEQVLAVAHATEDHHIRSGAAAVEEDAESCCGSSGGKEATEEDHSPAAVETGSGPRRACLGCRENEPCVLLLPCRHLCLCARCGSAHHCCPLCGSVMTGTVHVNMS